MGKSQAELQASGKSQQTLASAPQQTPPTSWAPWKGNNDIGWWSNFSQRIHLSFRPQNKLFVKWHKLSSNLSLVGKLRCWDNLGAQTLQRKIPENDFCTLCTSLIKYMVAVMMSYLVMVMLIYLVMVMVIFLVNVMMIYLVMVMVEAGFAASNWLGLTPC